MVEHSLSMQEVMGSMPACFFFFFNRAVVAQWSELWIIDQMMGFKPQHHQTATVEQGPNPLCSRGTVQLPYKLGYMKNRVSLCCNVYI